MAKKKRPLLDWIAWVPLRGVLLLFAWLPERLVYGFLASLGWIFRLCSKRRRAIVRANLERVYGKGAPQIPRIERAAFCEAFRVGGDLARMPRMVSSGAFDRLVETQELQDALEECRKRFPGKAPIFCTPHLGAWEQGGEALGKLAKRVHIIARPLGNLYLDRWVRRTRSMMGQEIHPRRGGIRLVVQGLKNGEPAGFLPDQNQRTRGLFIPFFGVLASTDRSPALLAIKGGHPLIMGASLRQDRGFSARIRVGAILDPASFEGESMEEKLQDGLLQIAQAMQSLVLEAPEQYFWLHDRWRTRPPSESTSLPPTKGPE
jgi:KDO2-lipid IV(A) lauroyltransferase